MNRGSVRWRITATAAVIAAVVLAVAAAVVVVVVQRELRDNLDRSLAQRADQIEAAALVDPDSALANSDREDRFAQVLVADGSVLFATDNVAGAPPLADLPAGRQEASTRSDLPLEDDAYRVLIRRFDLEAGPRYVVVGENIDDVTDGIRALMATLALVFPAATIVLAGVVWWLVGRTLRPVEEIRREVESIGLTELDRRVPTPGSGDEIDRLADTMNDMLARLEASAAVQRRFVADVSHELRTPLTRLRTALEVDLAHTDSDFESTCRAALGDAIDMQALVDDLLFLARRDSGRDDVRYEAVDLDVVVDEEVRLARAESEVTIDMSAVSAAVVRGEARQLARLVRNLLSNAVRHASGVVLVALDEDDDVGEVVLSVDDDGVGIPPDEHVRVFERFVRLDRARSARDGGTGLGLAIVADIVRTHGGTVTVDESRLGGASFVVRLPARSGEPADLWFGGAVRVPPTRQDGA